MRITNKTGNDVIILSAPRKSADDLLNIPESNNVGVYLLLSEKKVYVGQSTDLKTRIKNHLANKDWWNQVVLLTTVGDNLIITEEMASVGLGTDEIERVIAHYFP